MSKKKGGLGMGLDALFQGQAPLEEPVAAHSEAEKPENIGDSVVYVDINAIKPNENQPRKHFDSQKISELAQSIVEHGIIQPLVLRKIDNTRFEIVAGERRWRAAREAGVKRVPSIIRAFSDEENMIIAIIENMQREDLNSIEEAEGLRQMIETYGFTQEEVSKSVSKSRPYITNALRLLKLPEKIRKELAEGNITPGHGRALLATDDTKLQMEICKKIINEGISVRKTEALVASTNKPTKRKTLPQKLPEVARVERELKEIYGTKVTISNKGKKGNIQIEFCGKEELNRLIEMLRLEN